MVLDLERDHERDRARGQSANQTNPESSLSRYRIDIDGTNLFRARDIKICNKTSMNKVKESFVCARAQNRVGYMDCIERYGPALLFSPSASWRLQREPSTCVARSRSTRSRSKPIAREASAISPISLPDEQTGLWLERGTPNGRASSAPLRAFSSQISTSGRARHGS